MSTCKHCGYTSGWECICKIYKCTKCAVPLSIAEVHEWQDDIVCRTCFDEEHKHNLRTVLESHGQGRLFS